MLFTEVEQPDLFSTIAHEKENGNSVVVFNWTSVEGAVGYTVYWCKGDPHDCEVCISVAMCPF